MSHYDVHDTCNMQNILIRIRLEPGNSLRCFYFVATGHNNNFFIEFTNPHSTRNDKKRNFKLIYAVYEWNNQLSGVAVT